MSQFVSDCFQFLSIVRGHNLSCGVEPCHEVTFHRFLYQKTVSYTSRVTSRVISIYLSPKHCAKMSLISHLVVLSCFELHCAKQCCIEGCQVSFVLTCRVVSTSLMSVCVLSSCFELHCAKQCCAGLC